MPLESYSIADVKNELKTILFHMGNGLLIHENGLDNSI